MLKIILLFVAAFFGCQVIATPEDARHGNLNLYFIYSRDNPREPIQIQPDFNSVIESPALFRPYTAIIVHGHQGSAFTSLNPVVKDSFISSEDVTVIVVDWSTYAGQSYSNAVNAVPSVGVAIADMIRLLVTYNRISLDRLHLVGFDLGAHVVGFTGRSLNGQVARITGLDPNGSQWGSNSQRLTASDAEYVELIHTDGNGLTANGIGTALGDVDFFANGGGSQPGCLTHSCSHNRAWELFGASLLHNHLIGNLCNSSSQLNWNLCRGYSLHMGNNSLIKYGSGIFRVNTGRTFPY
ncbi:lipase member I-like [Pectinophora gossypiella]|uniref:lipase member I-like n=1 Tax=Pectinophora gossypiella TaxID=13191 RepID=UPI00214EE86E|nr:lipase member I-like [Pectinophora gossypiella]